MFLAITRLTFIDTIIIFNTFFQKLQSTRYSLLSKYLFGQIIKLPKDDSVGPLCNFFSRNIWKFSIGKQDIEFFDRNRTVLIHFKLLNSLDSLVDIFLPCDNFIHYFLNMIYVIGLIIDLPQRLNIVFTLLDQQSVSRLSICFELVNCFIYSQLQICTDSFNQFVQLYQIIKFPQFLLDFEMLRFSGPVIHFPQIFLLQLFKSNQIVFAFLVRELSKTD